MERKWVEMRHTEWRLSSIQQKNQCRERWPLPSFTAFKESALEEGNTSETDPEELALILVFPYFRKKPLLIFMKTIPGHFRFPNIVTRKLRNIRVTIPGNCSIAGYHYPEISLKKF